MAPTPTDPDLIETMLCRHGRELPLLGRHLMRLQTSARVLGYPWPGQANIERALRLALDEKSQGAGNWRVRLLLSARGEITVQVYGLQPLDQTPFIALAAERLSSSEPLLRHKTTFRPWYAQATEWLLDKPAYFDLVFANEHGALCEGSRSNIYVLKNGAWQTPPVRAGLLPGVMRSQLLEAGRAVEGDLTIGDLLQPTAQIRLSNGLRGWFDVTLCQIPCDSAQGTAAPPPG